MRCTFDDSNHLDNKDDNERTKILYNLCNMLLNKQLGHTTKENYGLYAYFIFFKCIGVRWVCLQGTKTVGGCLTHNA
jgi:hypothetical protein